MIDKILIENFKPFKRVEVKTKELNLLMGLNGMGKSSFIQVLLLMLQSAKLEDKIIALTGPLTDAGFERDVLYQFAQKENIIFEFIIDNEKYLWNCSYQKDRNILCADVGCSNDQIKNFREKTKLFQYIKAFRFGPMDVYPISPVDVSEKKQFGSMGEYAPHFIYNFGNSYDVPEIIRHPKARSSKLIHQVNEWLKEISPGVSLNTQIVPVVNIVTLNYQFDYGNSKTNPFLPKNVGFGISYVLPVILALLTAEKEKIIIIENPESHIHPRGQVEMGKLIALAAQNDAQLFVETHSDHILNGIRVAVKENMINKEKVNISFFDKETTETEQYARITSIQVDNNGSLSDYPDNFLDEWSTQLAKLI